MKLEEEADAAAEAAASELNQEPGTRQRDRGGGGARRGHQGVGRGLVHAARAGRALGAAARKVDEAARAHGHDERRLRAGWVNKRAKFDPAELDKAAAPATDESPISTFNSDSRWRPPSSRTTNNDEDDAPPCMRCLYRLN